jgi:dihydrofolate reductase
VISLIAAVARNGVIGDATGKFGLPWHIPADLKRFKQLTMGKPIIFGRTTWELIGRPLTGRRVIVLTRQSAWTGEGVEVASSLQDALEKCADTDEIFIGGGTQVYEQALPLADRLYLTKVELDAEGDAVFPAFQQEEWLEQARDAHPGEPAFTFVTLDRRARNKTFI